MSSDELQIIIYAFCGVTIIWSIIVSIAIIKDDNLCDSGDWVIDIVNGKPIKKEPK